MISTNCRTIFPSVRTLLLSLLLLAALPGQSQDIPPRPQQLVNDYANLLTPGEQSRLEHKLVEYNDTTSIQIAIALEVSLQGQDDFQRALDIAQGWGVGQSETDNGLLI